MMPEVKGAARQAAKGARAVAKTARAAAAASRIMKSIRPGEIEPFHRQELHRQEVCREENRQRQNTAREDQVTRDQAREARCESEERLVRKEDPLNLGAEGQKSAPLAGRFWEGVRGPHHLKSQDWKLPSYFPASHPPFAERPSEVDILLAPRPILNLANAYAGTA